ncbi:MAG: hypothetical protein AB7E98_12005 [Pirellulales bacterium]
MIRRDSFARSVLLVALCLVSAGWFSLAPQAHAFVLANIAQERVIQLPEDGQVWATIVFTSDHWQTNPLERQVLAWFDSDPRLASLKAQTKFYHYTASDPAYTHVPINKPGHSFAQIVQGQFPCVIVQTFEGTKVFKVSGEHMPRQANALAHGISQALKKAQREYVVATAQPAVAHDGVAHRDGKLFPRPRPKPCPAPTPTPTVPIVSSPTVVVGPPVIPDDVKEEEPAKEAPTGPNLGVAFVVGLIGAGIFAFAYLKNLTD